MPSRQSIASASTHDLPTLTGFWEQGDLALGEKIGLYPGDAVKALHQQRAAQKQALLDALHQAGALPARSQKKAEKLTMTPALNRAIHRFLADTDSALLGLQQPCLVNHLRESESLLQHYLLGTQDLGIVTMEIPRELS